MLTWVDLLVELGYLPEEAPVNRCPEDARPDFVAKTRGISWSYSFVNQFGVNETLKPGVRTSYAINDVATYNWREDEFSDASRQILALDGWWTWMTCLNAYWSYAPDVMGREVSIDEPFLYATMAGWRHANKSANAVFFDGSVRTLPTIKPLNVLDLRYKTFDTELAFTWLPGEQTVRASNQRYSGTHTEWNNRVPKLAGAGGDWSTNPAMPNELMMSWRSQNNLWTKFPNPADRR
jgi:prepilin-type processing-associated H-X9-DG protein